MSHEERPAAPLAIALFGPFDVRLQGRPLPRPHSQKTHWLLALLALQEGRALERAWLAGTLWPDSTEEQAAHNLRNSLWYLRQVLGPEARRLEAPTPGTLRLDLAGADADLLIFDEAIARGDAPSLERAVAVRRGPLLQGCEEDWVVPERAAREQAYRAALETLAADALTRGEPTEAVRHLRRLLAAAPLRESVHRALMQALASAGEYAAATQVYRDLRVLLHHELNTAPSPETTALYQQLRAQARERGGEGARGQSSQQASDGTPVPVIPSPPHPLIPSTFHPLIPSLPRPVSSFVGRLREVREITASLAAGRLVTLTGPGGVGKTRLAIQVGQEIGEEYAHAVCFVELAALRDAALVPHAVARALGAVEQPGRPLIETLREILRPRELLLVLDNCEHLIDACASLVQTLLHGCPGLRLLATSRRSLAISGETAWRVPPLSLPEASGVRRQASEETSGVRRQASVGDETDGPCRTDALRLTPDALLQSEALRLFVERGAAALRSFALSEENADAVLQVCRCLDGIPLALELAAARLPALSVEQILERLEDRFRLLTSSGHTAPPRQQTLRATLDWSYALLTDPERSLLHRLSVFAGGFTLGAAEAVCSDDHVFRCSDVEASDRTGSDRSDRSVRSVRSVPNTQTTEHPNTGTPERLNTQDVLDLLTALVDRSLVQYEGAGDRGSGRGAGRYRLLETVRQYAREKLLDSGEVEAVRDRHVAFYLQLAEEADAHLHGPEQIAWLERLDTEHDNLRGALEWSLDQLTVASCQSTVGADEPSPSLPTANCQPPTALRLAGALIAFWELRGHLEEGRRRLAAVLERAAPWQRSHAGARALEGAGVLASLQWDYAAARACYTESLEIRRESGDRNGVARLLGRLGLTVYEQGDGPTACSLLEESLAIARELGDPVALSGALIGRAHAAYYQGDNVLARALLEETLVIAREREDPAGIALALSRLGQIARRLEEFPLARALGEESLAIWRSLGDWGCVAEALVMLGTTVCAQQEFATARAQLKEALAIQRELGDGKGAATALDALADMARREGDYAAGRRCVEECLALWRAAGCQGRVIHALGLLGHLARAQGEYPQARAAYAESLVLRHQVQDLCAVINALEDFAELAASEGEWERTIRLLGAALAQREAAGKPLLPRGRAHYDAMLARARDALAEEATAAAWAEGQAMTLEHAVRVALSV